MAVDSQLLLCDRLHFIIRILLLLLRRCASLGRLRLLQHGNHLVHVFVLCALPWCLPFCVLGAGICPLLHKNLNNRLLANRRSSMQWCTRTLCFSLEIRSCLRQNGQHVLVTSECCQVHAGRLPLIPRVRSLLLRECASGAHFQQWLRQQMLHHVGMTRTAGHVQRVALFCSGSAIPGVCALSDKLLHYLHVAPGCCPMHRAHACRIWHCQAFFAMLR
mmetsp:Transcript_74064/g.209728  ORF Transcript_74064/g.209728 Transcript_74064/m.209728 type:complete len:218 (+) Transcript_74064:78-731(+)